jgi:tRNA threonylcarbamoyladenosine biosynthesis protein TsaB
VVVDEHSFEEFRNEKIVFFGPGMDKCRDVLSHLPNAEFCENIWPSARQMSIESERKFSANDFEDMAYFEPFYLKDFVAGKPKKIW